MSLEGRVALVSGGGRGIGASIALGLATDGADVAVNYRRDESAAQDIVSHIRAMGRRAMAVQASVDDFDADTIMVTEVEKELGPIGILVHNAGIASRGQSVQDTEPRELQRVMATHAFAGHYLAKLALPSMRTLGRGDIVMISSAATKSLRGNGAPYNMAKSALEALAYTLAKEVKKDGIRVNIVAPGLVETEMGRRLMRASAGVEDIRELDARMPFGRVCQPDDIANAVRYFVSDANSYMTGERLYVDGGGQNIRESY
ncbi:MAG: SDR family oxidoreductase [Chromatiales bacterium]|jgi:3-oxoacyl-[acyl-carrier protein] reductase|nr:SDR family oxidoreductase [Chromatiales bacterium]